MLGITLRQAQILDQIVEEYIETAKPISSHLLKERAGFGFCPATIRNEMQKLTEQGYLEQPHTSAGRVPTDIAYRFFVNRLKEIDFDKEFFQKSKEIIEQGKDFLEEVQLVLKSLSSFSLKFTLSYLAEKKLVLKEGWEEVFTEPEFKDFNYCQKFLRLVKELDQGIKNFVLDEKNGIKVYIGKENPLLTISEFSLIASACFLPNEEKGILLIVGPKRMAYQKNISLLNSAVRLLESLKL